MFAVDIWDYTIWTFCSVYRTYFGELDAVRDFAENAKNYDLLSLVRKFEHREKLMRLSEKYEQAPFLNPCDLIYEENLTAYKTKFKYKSTWGCLYYLRFDEASIKQAVVELDGRFYRIVTGTLKNFAQMFEPELNEFAIKLWGQTELIKPDLKGGDSLLSYRLYQTEAIYTTREEAIADCGDVDKINWDVFAEGIFGDDRDKKQSHKSTSRTNHSVRREKYEKLLRLSKYNGVGDFVYVQGLTNPREV